MNIKKLNEELDRILLNEISDKLKTQYLAGRQAQADKAVAKLGKAKELVRKSDTRQVSNLPDSTSKETAENALRALKYYMRKVSEGQDWRLEQKGDIMSLAVRYWGSWSGDDGSGDYDWQTLDKEYREILNDLVRKVSKQYGVQIQEINSEKNWLDFDITVAEEEDENKYQELWIKPLQKGNNDWLYDIANEFFENPVFGYDGKTDYSYSKYYPLCNFTLKMRENQPDVWTCFVIKSRGNADDKIKITYGAYDIVWNNDRSFRAGEPIIERTYTLENAEYIMDIKTWLTETFNRLDSVLSEI